MIARILTLMWKEFLELRQNPAAVRPDHRRADRAARRMLGYAATTDVKNVPIVVVDGDRSPLSRQLIERFSASPHFGIVAEELRPARRRSASRTGARVAGAS